MSFPNFKPWIQSNNTRSTVFFIRTAFLNFFLILSRNLRNFGGFFQQGCKQCNLRLQRKSFFQKVHIFSYVFPRNLSRIFSLLSKTVDSFVKTVFYVFWGTLWIQNFMLRTINFVNLFRSLGELFLAGLSKVHCMSLCPEDGSEDNYF